MNVVKKTVLFPALALVIGAFFFAAAWKVEPRVPDVPESYYDYDPPPVRLNPREYRSVLTETAAKRDIVLDFYRDLTTRDRVVAFFSELSGSEEVSAAILDNASAFDIAPSLAFALCWEESRYNVRAVNRNNQNDSVDRGLFQLNCCSFPSLGERDFFNPDINAYHGMSHLRYCLDTGGSEVAGLAMYNAGTGRVSIGGTPRKTLDYIARILKLQGNIESLFETEVVVSYQAAGEPAAGENPGEIQGFLRPIL
jgi:hypothetical protein